MITVWKFDLTIGRETNGDLHDISMPKGSQIIHVGIDPGIPNAAALRLWAVVDTEAKTEVRTFRVAGTNHKLSTISDKQYYHLGSAIMPPYIWHVFEIRIPAFLGLFPAGRGRPRD